MSNREPGQREADPLADAAVVCRERIQVGALALASVLVVAFVIGRVVLHGQPADAPGRLFMPFIILTPLACYWAMHRSRNVDVHPLLIALPFVAIECALAGLMLGQLGGMEGPYFYSSYVLPPFFVALPMPMRERVLGTGVGVSAFVAAFAFQQPDLWSYSMIHIPIVYLVSHSAMNLIMGHELFRLHVGRASLLADLGQRQEALADQNRWLREHGERQIHQAVMLSRELESVQQKERRQIARTLHDDLAQIILAARLEIDALAQRESEQASAGTLVEASKNALRMLDRHTRRAIEELRSSRPQGGPLRTLVEEALQDHPGARTVELELPATLETMELDGTSADVVRATIREGVTNALKHAAAQHVRVAFQRTAGQLELSIEDDGAPDVDASAQAARFGLQGLRERAIEANAEFLVEEANGTRLSLRLPLPGGSRSAR